MRFWTFLLAALALCSCSSGPNDTPVEVVLIGQQDSLSQRGVRLSTPAQQLRGAITEGLVTFGATGEVVPAIAERWIVTDDGLSYIFRLRDSTWASGDPITGSDIRAQLLTNIARLEGTSLGYDLAKVTEVRAMTGRVIEVRLSSQMPDFLRLLAQPELGFEKDGDGTGPMVPMDRDKDRAEATALILTAIAPEMRGFPARRDWDDRIRPVRVQALPAQKAVDAFANGDADLVLNGRIASFPMTDLGPFSRANIRLDANLGLFGLVVRNENGLLAEPDLREALIMSIDREALIEPFNIDGWQASDDIVPLRLWGEIGPEASSWTAMALEQRQQTARQRIAEWAQANEVDPTLTIGMPPGPGSDLLFAQLASNFTLIGVEAKLLPSGQGADLELHDRGARFAAPRWFLNQFHCQIRSGPCSPEADALVARSIIEASPRVKLELLARAELALRQKALFIPFGAPIRWSLVRSDVVAFEENAWGVHPLFPLSGAPI